MEPFRRGPADAHQLAGAYALDALDEEDRTVFERHCSTCEPCRAELAVFRQALTQLSGTLARTPPPALRDRLLAAVAASRRQREA
jgi:anti-sigma factor RsiW